jgi:hypothetical protein
VYDGLVSVDLEGLGGNEPGEAGEQEE